MNKEWKNYKIGIIGGGAAGLLAAVLLARAGFAVTILEKNDKIGKKLLITGNGRCNLSNRQAAAGHYFSRSGDLAGGILRRFPVEKTLAVFESLGITARELEGGKLYPYSLEAKTVVKAFLYQMEYLGIEVIYGAEVTALRKKENWQVFYRQKDLAESDRPEKNKLGKDKFSKNKALSEPKSRIFQDIILCTGGMSYAVSGSDGQGYELAGGLGHSLIPPRPAIVQLVMREKSFPYYKHLQGTKTEAALTLCDSQNQVLRRERGELLFTAYGVSGPPVLLLSTTAAYAWAEGKRLKLAVNFLPEMEKEEVCRFVREKLKTLPYFSVERLLEMFLPNRLVGVLLKHTDIPAGKTAAEISEKEQHKIVSFLTELELEAEKPYQWQQAQVTAGGISCREVDAATLESKKAAGLYLIGEILDVDGDCGGFNLQWAWSSAMAAAAAISQKRGDNEI